MAHDKVMGWLVMAFQHSMLCMVMVGKVWTYAVELSDNKTWALGVPGLQRRVP